MAPGVLRVQVEGRGRPGDVRRRVAPLGGGAVSRGGNAASAAAPKRATGTACGTPVAAARQAPKAAPKPPPKRGPPPQYGGYNNIRYVLQHSGGDLATEQRGTKTINVCPWSRLDGAGHCTWKAGTHCQPTHLHPKDLLDHIQRDHATDPAQRDQALAMLAGVMPGGQAGPFASAEARSRALTLPMGAQSAAERGASPSAARSGAIGSAAWRGAVTSTGSTAASRGGARRICRVSADDGRLGRRPTGTGATSLAARAGCGWPP